jgi:hypothetical protein
MESIALLKWIIWKKRWFFHSLTFGRLAMWRIKEALNFG